MNLSSNFNRLSFNKLPLLKQSEQAEVKPEEELVVVQKQPTKIPRAEKITASALDAEALQNLTFVSTATTVESNAAKKTGHLTEAEAKEQGYTIIKTAEDLVKILLDPSGSKPHLKLILMNDIDLSDKNVSGLRLYSSEFNGNGYTIKNFSANRGLFSSVTGDSIIKNLNFDNANVNAPYNGDAGVLVDWVCGNLTIEGCNITNSTININGSTHAGFLIGAQVNTSGEKAYEISIINCHVSSSNIIGKGACTPEVGGLVGYGSAEPLKIVNSSFQGGIEAEGKFAGGLVGRSTGSLIEVGCSSEVNKPEKIQYKYPDLIDMKQDEKDMKDAAYKQGLTESPCSGVYSKKVRSGNGYKTVYYIWNSNDKEFERCNDIKSINADGSYVNNRGKTINKPANEQIAARIGGYTPTVEEGTYFKGGKYYNYDEDSNEFFEVDKSLYEVHDEETTNTNGTKAEDTKTDDTKADGTKSDGSSTIKKPENRKFIEVDFDGTLTPYNPNSRLIKVKLPYDYPLYKRFNK